MIGPDLRQFIQDTFGSVWALEVLLFLKRAGRAVPLAAIVTELRASSSVVDQAVESLFAAGLLIVEEPDRSASYAPSSPDLAALVDQVDAVYTQRPDAVRRLIIAARSSSLTAFSDAFRIRRD